MKKIVFLFTMMALMVISFSSCSSATPDADEEGVLILKPWFFGHGGVDAEPVQTGLTYIAWTTDVVYFKITPQKYQVDMEDLMTDDSTPVDFHSVIIIQIKKGKTPILMQNYGVDWFNTNIYNFYANRVRDHVSRHNPFDLMSNREILNKIDESILKELQDYVAQLSTEAEMPIIIKSVTIGKAIPNAEQLAEMNKTAKAVQARQTQEKEIEVQLAREKAERQRAIADKAYMQEMGLTSSEFINLRMIDVISNKKDANIDVLFDANASKMWNIRR